MELMQAQWLGGSFVGSAESFDGELKVPLASGATLSLQLTKVRFWNLLHCTAFCLLPLSIYLVLTTKIRFLLYVM